MASVALFSISAYPSVAQTIVRPTLTAAQCQPLLADNADLCCIAMNRQMLLTDQEIDQCPPITTSRIESVMEAQEAGNSDNATDGTVSTDGTASIDGSAPTDGTVATDGTDTTDGTDPTETGAIDANANSGAGNGGEPGAGEDGDTDPGSSADNNNSPDSPPGQN